MAEAAYLALDTETTGLQPHDCALIELGAIVLDKQLQPIMDEGSVFHTFVQPHGNAVIERKAIEINGHSWAVDPTHETYLAAPTPPDAWKLFVTYLAKWFPKLNWIITVGWNPGFDTDFLKAMHLRHLQRVALQVGVPVKEMVRKPLEGHGWPFHYHSIDGIGIARYLDIRTGQTRKSYSLANMRKDLCPTGGMAEKYGASHTALADVFAMLDVLQIMETQYLHAAFDSAAPTS